MAESTPQVLERWAAAAAAMALVAGCTQWGWRVAGAYVSPADPLVWGAAVLAVASAWRARVRAATWVPPMAAWILVASAASGVLRAASRVDAAKEAFQWAEYFLAGYAAFALAVRDATWRRRFVALFLVISGVMVAWAAVQYADRGRAFFHVQAAFGNRNVFGGFVALSVPLAVSLAASPRVAWLWRCALTLLALAGLAVTGSGGSLIGLACGLGLLAAWRGRLAFLAYVAALALAAGWLLPALPRGNLKAAVESIALFDAEGLATPRCTEWQAALNLWAERPVLGAGAGSYQANVGACYGYIPRENRNVTEPDSHNLYLVMAATTGVVGLAALAGLLLAGGIGAARAMGGAEGVDRAVAAGVAASLLAFAVSAVWAGLLVRGLGVPLAFLLALGAGGGTRAGRASACGVPGNERSA